MIDEKLAEMISKEVREVDKYQVEVANSALEKVVIPPSLEDRLSVSVNAQNGKIVFIAKPNPAE